MALTRRSCDDHAMSVFIGGSAYSMVQQVAGGFLLVTERHFKRMSPADLGQLTTEIEKVLREVRGQQAAQDDVQAIRDRNRKLQRLNSCRTMLQSYRLKRRR